MPLLDVDVKSKTEEVEVVIPRFEPTTMFVFCVDTSEYSFPYIVGWSSGRDMKELKASMDIIRKTVGTACREKAAPGIRTETEIDTGYGSCRVSF